MSTSYLHRLRRAAAISAVVLAGALPLLSSASAGAQAEVPNYVPGEVLVRFRAGVGPDQARGVANGIGAALAESTRQSRLGRLRLGAGAGVEQALQALRNNPNVEHAQPNFVYRAIALTEPHAPAHPAQANDFKYWDRSLWGLNNEGLDYYGNPLGVADADIDAPEAWAHSTGSRDIVVAVLDTGIDYRHKDFSSPDTGQLMVDPKTSGATNIWINPGETGLDSAGANKQTNGVDDDRNGYIDDVHGINAIAAKSDPRAGDPLDDNDHGTHVAGTIGALSDVDEVVGVSQAVSIIGCKFLDAAGSGNTFDAVECLDYLHALKDAGINIVASNNSWGGAPYDAALRDAIVRSRDRGILFIAAAGNGDFLGRPVNTDSSAHYPSGYDVENIISVTATNNSDKKASWANYGVNTVDLGAPGVGVLSTIRLVDGRNPYAYFDGTSMATPHVTGAVALLCAADPSFAQLPRTDFAAAVKDRILNTGDLCADLEGKTVTGRRLNVHNAVTNTRPAKQEMTVGVTTNKSLYRIGETVYITVTAADAATGTGLAGASIALEVRTPKGNRHSTTGTTNSEGSATFSYTTKKTYGTGVYTVTATVSKSGYNSKSGSRTFEAR